MAKYTIEIKPQPDPKNTGEWYFTVEAQNGKTVMPVEGHNNLEDVMKLINRLKADFVSAPIYITGKDGVRQTVSQYHKSLKTKSVKK